MSFCESINHDALRVLVFSAGKGNPKRITEELEELLPKGSKLIVAGNKRTEFVMSGLIRMKKRRGKIAELQKHNEYSSCNVDLIENDEFNESIMMGIDHIQRRAYSFSWRHHSLNSVSDTMHYYHIVSNMLSEFLNREKINLVLFLNYPHLFYDTIIYQVAKSKGIETILFTHSLFDNKYFSLKDIQHQGEFPFRSDCCIDQTKYFEINPNETPIWEYMKSVKQERDEFGSLCWRGVLQFMINMSAAEFSKLFDLKFIRLSLSRMRRISSRMPKWRYPFLKYFHSSHLDYFETLLQFEEDKVNLNCDYVYFPLQLQPEMTTSTLGGFYSDQLLAIEQLAKLVPNDCLIYVKENPKQTGRMRNPIFFKRLFRVSNVRFLPSYANTYKLIDHSQFVSTITGTVGWEAICRGKNALIFGLCWYRSMSGVFEYNEELNYEEVRDHRIDQAILEKEINQLLDRAHRGNITESTANISHGKYSSNAEVSSIAHSILSLIKSESSCTFVPLK